MTSGTVVFTLDMNLMNTTGTAYGSGTPTSFSSITIDVPTNVNYVVDVVNKLVDEEHDFRIRRELQFRHERQPAALEYRGNEYAHHDRGIEAAALQSTAATIEVVVVLPCMPAIAIPYFNRINSASISAR